MPNSAPWRHFFVRYINSFYEGGSNGDVEGPQPTPQELVAKSQPKQNNQTNEANDTSKL